MAHTIQLKEGEHTVGMFCNIRRMRAGEQFCDFTIRVKDYAFRAHKLVLCAGSAYFEAMLKHDTVENRNSEVVMKNVDAECVRSCIDFLYTAKFDMKEEAMCDLLQVATIMQLEKVKEAIGDILMQNLNAENFYDTKIIAEAFSLQSLLTACKRYFAKNLLAISTLSDFESESVGKLVSVFKEKQSSLSEEDKLSAALRWVGKDVEKKEFLFDLLKPIKFALIPSEMVSDLLEKHHFINDNFRLYKMITASMITFLKKSSVNINNKMLILFDEGADCIQTCYPKTVQTLETVKINHESFKDFEHFKAVTIDPYIYMLCLGRSVHRLNFRFGNSKWERMQDMIFSHGGRPPSASLSGSIFVFGSTNAPTYDAERFDPDKNEWVRLEDLPQPMFDAAILPIDDSIYCIGGLGVDSNGLDCVDSFSKFVPATSEWHNLQPMIHKGSCIAVAANQKIYVICSFWPHCSPGLRVLDCYDIFSQQWTSLTSHIPGGMSHFSAVHHWDGWLYIFPHRVPTRHIKAYNIASNTWHFVVWENEVDDVKVMEVVAVQTET